MSDVSIEDQFLFDLQGFILLRDVLSPDECTALLDVLYHLELQSYSDEWQAGLPADQTGRPTRETNASHQVRLNGLPRLDPIFDKLIDHPRILPYLNAFVGDPQLINTWSISKDQDTPQGGWHRGVPTSDYVYHQGEIRSRMFNTVYFLTDNGSEDGCIMALPGSHKSNLDLNWSQYEGLDMPGSVSVTGQAGDVLIFSETVVHNGLRKTTTGIRSNLYYNYVHAHYNVVMREPTNIHHFFFPSEVRDRFTDSQREMTRWMEQVRWGY